MTPVGPIPSRHAGISERTRRFIGAFLVHFGLQVRLSPCNLEQRKFLKTRENRRVQTGQVGLANRRQDLALPKFNQLMRRQLKGTRSPEFSPYLPNRARLTSLRSILSV